MTVKEKRCTDIETRHDVKIILMGRIRVSGQADRGFTLLVQLSCVSRHYKDRRRENRGADVTACLATQSSCKGS